MGTLETHTLGRQVITKELTDTDWVKLFKGNPQLYNKLILAHMQAERWLLEEKQEGENQFLESVAQHTIGFGRGKQE